jgi:hypothetical protein
MSMHGKTRRVAIALWLAIFIPCVASAEGVATSNKRRFESRDAVEMAGFSGENYFSPDGRYFVTVTQRGLLPQGVSETTLWLFDVEAIRKSVDRDSSSDLPAPVPLARLTAAINSGSAVMNRGLIMQPIWEKEGQSLLFHGDEPCRNSPFVGHPVDICSATTLLRRAAIEEHHERRELYRIRIDTCDGKTLGRCDAPDELRERIEQTAGRIDSCAGRIEQRSDTRHLCHSGSEESRGSTEGRRAALDKRGDAQRPASQVTDLQPIKCGRDDASHRGAPRRPTPNPAANMRRSTQNTRTSRPHIGAT